MSEVGYQRAAVRTAGDQDWQPEACVIGAGPAGEAVSRVLAAAGVSHDVLDENRRAGGNINRRPLDGPATAMESAVTGTTRLSLAVDVIDVTRDGIVTWLAGERLARRRYGAVFICTGAYDAAFPRRGLRSRGVGTVGAFHALLKAQELVPCGPIVVAGAGPFLWVAAADLSSAGCDVRAVIDRVTLRSYVSLGLLALLVVPRRSAGFLAGVARLFLKGALIRIGATADIVEPGVLRLQGRRLPFAHLGVTDLFAPQTQLARSAECVQAYSARGHYFFTVTDPDGRTSVPNIFVCGEGQSVRGREHAIVSGELAARAFARQIGRPVRGGRLLRIRRWLLRLYADRLEGAMYAHDHRGEAFSSDSEACMCERVSVTAVERAIALGLRDMTSIKSVTRCGMGTCQGRYCEPILTRLIERAGGHPGEPFHQKGFVRPVNVRTLINADV